MFYEEIRTKQDLSYISICTLSILYNSKFILMAMSSGTNDVVITRVHCNFLLEKNPLSRAQVLVRPIILPAQASSVLQHPSEHLGHVP